MASDAVFVVCLADRRGLDGLGRKWANNKSYMGLGKT